MASKQVIADDESTVSDVDSLQAWIVWWIQAETYWCLYLYTVIYG